MNDKILEVKHLRISFKTNTGTVKAVRGIDFTLHKGRTLAIVGESGSGKSVTSKAILGILANNSIIEDGEIIYDGNDLLSLNEEQFSAVRGVKISMIFQDPLSALNPIQIVGKQLMEAMYLEHKANKKASKKEYLKIEKLLAKYNSSLSSSLKQARNNNDENSRKEAVSALFNDIKEASKGNNEQYLLSLGTAKEKALSIQENILNNEEAFDSKLLLKEANILIRLLKKCINIFSLRPDNVIDVYPFSIKNNVKKMKESIKYQEHIEKVLADKNVESVYDLPAALRCKEKEVYKHKDEFFKTLVHINQKLINHLDELMNQYKDVNDELVQGLIDNYLDKIQKSHLSMSKKDAKERAIVLMKEVGIPEPERRFYQYPFEFSGGMRQRIVIAIALSGNPEVLICDEPTTALDVTIQAQILELINRLKKEKNLSIIFITHDLGVVANMADDIAVMYAGKIVEYGTVYDIFYDPRHPYTWALLGSMPDLNTTGKLDAIPGTPPNMLLPPKGDAFAARNNYAIALDYKQEAPFFKISETHYAKTWLVHDDAPDMEAPKIVKDRIINSLTKNPKNKPEYILKKNSILESLKGGK